MSNLERMIAPVPASTYAQAGIAAGQKWTADYNVACWVRGRAQFASTVTLSLRYRDGTGDRQVVVDRAGCDKESSLLLSSRVRVPATGRIEEMTVWLFGEPACELFVDELYVQRTGSDAGARPLLATR
ncbi:MAG: hypothetical protein ACOY3X_12205 [Pseudomonadota bacterium]